MTPYARSIQYLNSFIDFEKVSFPPGQRKWNLERMKRLLHRFDHPEKSYFSVVIAGTKGKGSTGFFLESILRANGENVGFYTSPHLQDPRERVRIQGKMISKKRWCGILAQIRQKLKQEPGSFTYFEIMTLMAALAFKSAGVRAAIFEVGMGGRWDAANAIDSPLAMMTPIHLDHEQLLGNTIGKIAKEKAEVIKRGSVVVTGPQSEEAKKTIKQKCLKQKARLIYSRPLNGRWKLGLQGRFQKINAGIAVRAVQSLNENFSFTIPIQSIRKGLENNAWPGRYETLRRHPLWMVDAAHNPASVKALVESLKRDHHKRSRILIFGVNRDKDSDQMLKILSSFFRTAVVTSIRSLRSQEPVTLMKQARAYFDCIIPALNSRDAVRQAEFLAGRNDLIVVTGSIYLVGEIRGMLHHA